VTIQRLILSLMTLGLGACTHTPEPVPLPAEYSFPAKFYVEQKLSVVSPSGNKQMVGQLERRDDEFKLVLTDVLTGIVLTQVVMVKNQEPKILYLAPILLDKKFPGEKISEAIQYLYESGPIPLVNTIYTVEDPQKRWTYKWQTLRGDKDCLFPEDISLSFADERFNVMISLKELDCKI
jgi:hypothetical protein